MALRWLGASIVIAACLAAAGTSQARVPRPSATAQLALMPLPQSAFGRRATALKLDAAESGVRDNAKAADGTTTKSDSAASLTKAGRITGYEVTFDDFGLIGKPGRLVGVSSEVDLYRSAKAASVGLKAGLADVTASDPANGLRILSSKRFAAPGLGDEATGVRVQAKFATVVLWVTGVIFRRGDLVGELDVIRTDSASEQGAVLGLSRALSARIQGVLAGKVTAPAVNLPSPKAKKAVTPAVKIDAGAITSADLNGAKVTRGEYVKDSDAISAYEREFDSIRYGKTRLLSAENDVSLYASAAAAMVFIGTMTAVFNPANPSFKSFIANAFSQGAGFKVNSVAVVSHRPLALGGSSGTELVMRVGTPLGQVEVAYAFVASGRLATALILTASFGSSIGSADLARLEGKAVQRVQALGKTLPAPA